MCFPLHSLLLSAALVVPAEQVGCPRWISVMRFFEDEKGMAEDAVRLGNETIVDGLAYSCSVHPEGDPAADKAADYAARFSRFAPMVRKSTSVKIGILMQSTMGHGGEPGSRTPWQLAVHSDGKVNYRFCPLDRDFLAYIAKVCRTFSAAKPDFFMVDDDTRLVWKHPGCFCPLHLAEFAARSGRSWTREEVVAKLEAGDKSVTEQWFALKTDSLKAFFRTIRDNYSPSVPGIFCTVSSPEHLRHAREFAQILAAPGQVPVVRGNGAPYHDSALESIALLRGTYAAQRAIVGEDVVFLQESDTCPHTRWATSSTRLVDHMVELALEGVKGAKIWITRSEPDEDRSRAAYRAAFRRNRGLMEWAAKADFHEGGFVIPRAALVKRANCRGDWGARYFSRTGIPYRLGKTAKGEVVALSGQTVDDLNDGELREILSGRVLLDGTAALRLGQLGFAAEIGVAAKPWSGKTIQRQSFPDGRTLRCGLLAGSADLSDVKDGAAIRARLYNRPQLGADFNYVAPGSVLFTNALGGVVYTFACALTANRPGYNQSTMYSETFRDEVVQAGVELAGEIPGGLFYRGDEPMMVRVGETSDDGRVFVLDNLELDDEPHPEIVFTRVPAVIERLSCDGCWTPVRFVVGKNGVVTLETVVRTQEPAVFRVDFPCKMKKGS